MRILVVLHVGAALALAAGTGCASIPPGAVAVDTMSVAGNRAVSSSDIQERMATTASPRFLGLFPGVAREYEI